MASIKLTDAVVRKIKPPAKDPTGRTLSRVTYDSEVRGFGVRITSNGARSFVLTYRMKSRRERRVTIGGFPEWSTKSAREQAARLKRDVDLGDDPLAKIEAEREAPTVEKMCKRFVEEHLPKLRPSTRSFYETYTKNDVLPAMRHLKVAEVTYSDVDALHRKISRRSRHGANRVVALLSKMFNLAVKWRWRADNPCKGVERNHEDKRERYLTGAETTKLKAVLDALEDQASADVVRLLMLTGARRNEVLSMTWHQVELKEQVWVKPSHQTKQKKMHRVPLSEDACEVIARQPRTSIFVFPGEGATGHREGIRKTWAKVAKEADLAGVRIHDLRHNFASVLASSGLSLPIIGAMMGHSSPVTTHRYAHLTDDALRDAAELAAAGIRTPRAGKVVKITQS